MPTPFNVIAAVAAQLGGIDATDHYAVREFYATTYAGYASARQALIADFLMAATAMPSDAALMKLKQAVDGPLSAVPAIESPGGAFERLRA